MAATYFLRPLFRSRWVRWSAFAAGLLLAIVGAFYGLLYTEWFQESVRRRVIAEAEAATGGRVEIAHLHFDPDRLLVRVEGLVILAPEAPAGAAPFLTVPLLQLELGIDSLLGQKVSLRAMEVDSPQIQVLVGPEGVANLPAFPSSGVGADVDLFELAVGRVDLNDGSLLWNDARYPISFSVEQLQLRTRYEPSESRYRAWLRLGESEFEIAKTNPGLTEGEGEFFIYRDRVEAPEIYLAGGGARIRAALKVESFDKPQMIVKYQSTAALGDVARRLGLAALRSGTARTFGEVRWDSARRELNVNGRLEVIDVIVQNAGTEPLSVRAEYEGNLDRLHIRNIEAVGWQGKLTGDTTLEELQSGSPRFVFGGALEGFPLELLLAAVGSVYPGVAELPYSATLNGTVHASGRARGGAPGDLEATIELTLMKPVRVAPGRTPLEGAIDLSYSRSAKVFSLSRLELATDTARLEVQGAMTNAQETSLRIRAKLDDFQDPLTVARTLGVEVEEPPLELRGSVHLRGDLSGRFLSDEPNLAFSGRLEASDFDIAGYPLKGFQGDVEVSKDRLELRRALVEDLVGSARVSFGADLEDLWFSRITSFPISHMEGVVQLNGVSLAKLLGAAGRPEPLTGKLNGQIRFAGPLSEWAGSAGLEVVEGSAWGEPFDHIRAAARFADKTLSVDSFQIQRKATRMDAKATLNTGDGRYQVDLRGNDWRLEDLERFAENRKRLSGRLTFTLRGSGRLEAGQDPFKELVADGTLDLRDLTIDELQVGAFSAKVESSNRRVNVAWQGNLFSGGLRGRAEILPAEGRPYQGECEIANLDIVHLGKLADFEVRETSGELDAKLRFSGKVADPDSFAAQGELTRLKVSYSRVPGSDRGYALWNPFPMRWSVGDGKLDIDQARLLGDGTDLVIDGSVGLKDGFGRRQDSLDLSLGGIFNLAVLESFRPGLDAGGSSELNVTIRGGIERPTIRGQMRLKDGNLRYIGFANGLSQVNGQLSFNERLIRVEELGAASGGGTVSLVGTVLYESEQWDYRLRADIERVRVRYPESVGSVIDGRLTFSGSNLRSLLSGDVVLNRVTVGSGVTFGDVMASLSEPTQTPASNPVLLQMQLNVQITSVPNLVIETPLIRNVEAYVDLRLAGTAVQPSLLGDIKIPQGDVMFSGSRYTINRGVVDFYNPFRVEPVVNFELETRVRDVDITLTLSGPTSGLNLSYRSDPPLRFDELVTLIAAGRSPTTDPVLAAQETVDRHPFLQTGANVILSNVLTRPGSQRLQRFFGVSRLKVDPQIGGAEANPSARISTEQQITKDLTFTYSYDLSSAQQQVIRVEWAPTRQWSFIVTRDENGLVGADVLFKKRLR